MSHCSEMHFDDDMCCVGADSDNADDDEACDEMNGEADIDSSSDDDDDNDDVRTVSECSVAPMIE